MSHSPREGQRYPIPSRPYRVEEVIHKSRFITTVAHAPDPETAHAFVERIREEFPDSTHNCWAFIAGPPGSTARIGMSDDGEPHGTAGRPMLHTLLHSEVGEVVAVCTRYFGGTKLGTGGLSRAYSGGVKLALESLPRQEKVKRILLEIQVEYDAVDGLKRLLEEVEGLVEGEEYGAQVTYRVAIPLESVDSLEHGLAEISRGRAQIRVVTAENPEKG